MRRAWIALLVILIGVLSQPPTKCRGVVAQVVESQPTRGNYARAGYKGDANQAFPSVDTAQATNAQVKSDEEAQDRKTNTAINGQIRYFNGGLLIVAVFALGAAILQWRTYKAQTEIFKAQNRAFVYLEPLKLEPMSTDGGVIREWRVIASFKNSGSTPAMRLVVDIQRADLPAAELKSFSFNPDYSKARKIFLGPHNSAEIHGPGFGRRDIEKTFGANKTHVLIWGWMEYDDVFSTTRHRTEFCFELNADVVIDLDHPLASHNVPHFTMHPRHNGADSECLHHPHPYQA
jgi:hypothetical protein